MALFIKPFLQNDDGFTLLEIIAAISILTVGILAVGAMQISSIRGNDLASNLTEASTVAQDKIEHIIALDYNHSDLQDTNGSGTSGMDNTETNPDFGPEASDDGRYSLYWNVAPDYPLVDTKTIRVIVTWQDRGASKSLSLDYIKAIVI